MENNEFKEIMKISRETSEGFSPDVIFIGGIATYQHATQNSYIQDFASITHDGDFMISKAEYGDLKEIESMSINRRLSKSQFTRGVLEFDVYVEDVHTLPITYQEAKEFSIEIDGINVACPEHILVMKKDAYLSRRGTEKGDKDERDMFTLLVVIGTNGTNAEKSYKIDDNLLDILNNIVLKRGPEIAEGNLHLGRQLKDKAQEGILAIINSRSAIHKL